MTTTDRNLLVLLGAAFLAGVMVASATGAFATRPELGAGTAPADAAPKSVASSAPTDDPGAEAARHTPVVAAVERVAPTVVSITTETPVQSWFGTQTASSEGSGVVIDPSGVVLTNAHVVAQAQTIQASFADGTAYEADVLGLDQDLDLAVLKLQGAHDLTAVTIGSSAELMLGEPVIAIGNPYGLGHTVTTGVVSSLHRSLETRERVYQDFIQTDASINPGNSGGPLLDLRGRLVGINTAIYAEGQNIGFAIPSDRALKVAGDLVQFGSVVAPWLGCDLQDLTMRGPSGARATVKISRIYQGSGADRAGLQKGDIILEADGRAVQGRADLNAFLAAFSPGRVVDLKILRGDKESSIKVTSQAIDPKLVDDILSRVLGVTVAPLTPEAAKRFPPRVQGVLVTSVTPDGAFAKAGLRASDLISDINGQRVTSEDELRQILLRAKSGHRGEALVTVWRGKATGRFQLTI